ALGHDGAGVALSGYGAIRAAERAALERAATVVALGERDQQRLADAGVGAVRMDELLRRDGARQAAGGELPPVGCDGSTEQRELLQSLGRSPVDLGADPLPSSFAFGPADRRAAEQRLVVAEQQGAQQILVTDPVALARWALVTRDGTWRRARARAVLPHQLLPSPARLAASNPARSEAS
ncbi:MAG: hypothetical protein JRI23_34980, partial [Deltaproteobacteria bacterium]|nr:hypothetical protein [Deltaproteobacteria bacterium]MBW2537512.1 hypothetical protein [Deltaproteobacteria bacterium]